MNDRPIYEGKVKFWYVPKDDPNGGKWVYGIAKRSGDNGYIIEFENGGSLHMTTDQVQFNSALGVNSWYSTDFA